MHWRMCDAELSNCLSFVANSQSSLASGGCTRDDKSWGDACSEANWYVSPLSVAPFCPLGKCRFCKANQAVTFSVLSLLPISPITTEEYFHSLWLGCQDHLRSYKDQQDELRKDSLLYSIAIKPKIKN